MSVKYAVGQMVVGFLETNCYIFADPESRKAAVIDPGAEPGRILSLLRKEKLQIECIINTHGHADHIGANEEIKKETGALIYIHKMDEQYLADPEKNYSSFTSAPFVSPGADRLLSDGDIINLGALRLKAVHTPGHTPGSMVLVCENLLFSGDTLFAGSVGRCDLPGGDGKTLQESLYKFLDLPPEMKVLPGHGPASLLKNELKHNPYLMALNKK